MRLSVLAKEINQLQISENGDSKEYESGSSSSKHSDTKEYDQTSINLSNLKIKNVELSKANYKLNISSYNNSSIKYMNRDKN